MHLSVAETMIWFFEFVEDGKETEKPKVVILKSVSNIGANSHERDSLIIIVFWRVGEIENRFPMYFFGSRTSLKIFQASFSQLQKLRL